MEASLATHVYTTSKVKSVFMQKLRKYEPAELRWSQIWLDQRL